METETFIPEVKVGFGVVVLGLFRFLFIRMVRELVILEYKLRCAIKKRLRIHQKRR